VLKVEEEDNSKEQARWQMSRVGILNFWYYDDEEFTLEDGRLILRGANGSGKSVTMQSFLPLVLDGDKRASRLDPFGSRDRRIEYYLLGETDSGKSDVTGYLWMEFHHPGKNLYKTVGIGLRARRGAAQVQFWGFLLEDGRRVGHDFWLYDRNHWLERSVRIPLARRELEEKINTGGQVVQEQGAYRDMVNKQFFGFADAETFQDLLQLLIQLRSPKLSKDFKPSAIYDILHKALPPLQEDELRPLSEVLEDMDQIADRLDEVRMHRKEMAKLQDIYDRYNKQTLYTKSIMLLEKHGEYVDYDRRTVEAGQSLDVAESDKVKAQQDDDAIEARLVETNAELDVLEKHEAIGKQRELEAANTSFEETKRYLEHTKDSLCKQKDRVVKLDLDMDEADKKQRSLAAEQRSRLEDLESMAQETEFTAHHVYHRYWEQAEPEDDGWKEPWRKDLRSHREHLESALNKAQEEREAAGLVRQLEVELGEANKERDEAEREQGIRDKRLDQSKESVKEAVMAWKMALKELPYDDEWIRRSFAAISEFGPEQRSYESVRSPLFEAAGQHREQIVNERLNFEHEKEQMVREKERLEEEKRGWENSREPEPQRREGRLKARSQREAGTGAPLYAVCDFQSHMDEQSRAWVEEALERSGLLDAWISTGGSIITHSDEQEEFWIISDPHEIGYTLADVLVPSIPEDSGLESSVVDAVLRTFLWDESGDESSYHGLGNVISGNGSFRLGPLAGKSAKKTRAELIGKEARRNTRKLEISRLQQELEKMAEQITLVEASIQVSTDREQLLRAETAAFPDGKELQIDLKELLEAVYRIESAVRQELKSLERFKARSAKWRELQRQLMDMTAGWSRLKREKELQEAVQTCREYDSVISELHSAWTRSRDMGKQLERYREERQTSLQVLENDEILEDELDDRCRKLKAQINALNELMEELGLTEIANRIENIKAERKRLERSRKDLRVVWDEAKDKAASLKERLSIFNERLLELTGELERLAAEWHREQGRNLLVDWHDFYKKEMDMIASHKLAKEIRSRYESLFANRNEEVIKSQLLEQFNAVRMILTDYILESDVEEDTGRILILSKRDRIHPQPPQILLEELQRLEEEQGLLLSEKDRELYEEIILRSVGKAIRQRIHKAEDWVKQMNRLMEERNTSSGLRLKLEWHAMPAQTEQQMDTAVLVELLKRDSHRLREEEIDLIIGHFRSQIGYAKQNAQDEQESLRKHLYEVLDYRNWFQFELRYRKGDQAGYRPLTDSRFNVLSGGEKAMAMYIPLFAATWSRYSDARSDCPRLISLDEAFAGVDEENMRDMFKLLTDMGFDFMMTSQVLWGCYDTVPKLSIYEIHRPKDVDFITLFHYRWNGKIKEYVTDNKAGAEL
jgi:uncharacterized protein (TIGR02680 family)